MFRSLVEDVSITIMPIMPIALRTVCLFLRRRCVNLKRYSSNDPARGYRHGGNEETCCERPARRGVVPKGFRRRPAPTGGPLSTGEDSPRGALRLVYGYSLRLLSIVGRDAEYVLTIVCDVRFWSAMNTGSDTGMCVWRRSTIGVAFFGRHFSDRLLPTITD